MVRRRLFMLSITVALAYLLTLVVSALPSVRTSVAMAAANKEMTPQWWDAAVGVSHDADTVNTVSAMQCQDEHCMPGIDTLSHDSLRSSLDPFLRASVETGSSTSKAISPSSTSRPSLPLLILISASIAALFSALCLSVIFYIRLRSRRNVESVWELMPWVEKRGVEEGPLGVQVDWLSQDSTTKHEEEEAWLLGDWDDTPGVPAQDAPAEEAVEEQDLGRRRAEADAWKWGTLSEISADRSADAGSPQHGGRSPSEADLGVMEHSPLDFGPALLGRGIGGDLWAVDSAAGVASGEPGSALVDVSSPDQTSVAESGGESLPTACSVQDDGHHFLDGDDSMRRLDSGASSETLRRLAPSVHKEQLSDNPFDDEYALEEEQQQDPYLRPALVLDTSSFVDPGVPVQRESTTDSAASLAAVTLAEINVAIYPPSSEPPLSSPLQNNQPSWISGFAEHADLPSSPLSSSPSSPLESPPGAAGALSDDEVDEVDEQRVALPGSPSWPSRDNTLVNDAPTAVPFAPKMFSSPPPLPKFPLPSFVEQPVPHIEVSSTEDEKSHLPYSVDRGYVGYIKGSLDSDVDSFPIYVKSLASEDLDPRAERNLSPVVISVEPWLIALPPSPQPSPRLSPSDLDTKSTAASRTGSPSPTAPRPLWSLRAADSPSLALTPSSSPKPPPRLLSARSSPSPGSTSLPGSFPTTPSAPSPPSDVVSGPRADRPRGYRHPFPGLDLALAMQLRPGLGPGADAAWMVRFLMAMFAWLGVVVQLGGGARRAGAGEKAKMPVEREGGEARLLQEKADEDGGELVPDGSVISPSEDEILPLD